MTERVSKRGLPMVFSVRRIEQMDISELDREEKIKEYNKIANDDNKDCSFDNEFIHESSNIIVRHGEWIEVDPKEEKEWMSKKLTQDN